MPTKIILLAIVGVLVISGAAYRAPPTKKKKEIAPHVSTLQVSENKKINGRLGEESSSSLKIRTSSNEIVDYLVDDITNNEDVETEKILNGEQSGNIITGTISTNF